MKTSLYLIYAPGKYSFPKGFFLERYWQRQSFEVIREIEKQISTNLVFLENILRMEFEMDYSSINEDRGMINWIMFVCNNGLVAIVILLSQFK